MPWDCGRSVREKKVDAEYWTHLAINWGCTVEINQEKNYDREAGHARNRVNLSREYY